MQILIKLVSVTMVFSNLNAQMYYPWNQVNYPQVPPLPLLPAPIVLPAIPIAGSAGGLGVGYQHKTKSFVTLLDLGPTSMRTVTAARMYGMKRRKMDDPSTKKFFVIPKVDEPLDVSLFETRISSKDRDIYNSSETFRNANRTLFNLANVTLSKYVKNESLFNKTLFHFANMTNILDVTRITLADNTNKTLNF